MLLLPPPGYAVTEDLWKQWLVYQMKQLKQTSKTSYAKKRICIMECCNSEKTEVDNVDLLNFLKNPTFKNMITEIVEENIMVLRDEIKDLNMQIWKPATSI